VRSAELLGGAGRLWRGARADRPVGAVGLAGRVSQSRGWDLRRVLALGTVLSCAVGLFNLLPFPGLDGGRVCLELVEAGRRRRLPPRVATGVQVAGALLLLVAWLVITIADVAAPR
jgi:regulator of sigma E protease